VTGVRDAGKSALTRYLLAQFERDYFTLEITAPVRHDPDLGFFISVCRAVCRKTLDDLEPILQGKRAGAGGKLWQQIRNPALILLALVAVSSLLWKQMENLAGVKSEYLTRGEKAWDNWVQDPLLGPVDTLFQCKSSLRPDPQIITFSHKLYLSVNRFGWGIETAALEGRSVLERGMECGYERLGASLVCWVSSLDPVSCFKINGLVFILPLRNAAPAASRR